MRTILVAMMLAGAAMTASAADPVKAESSKALEEAFNAALASKRGVTLYVNGQAIGGAITRVEPGKYVELRNQEFSRIVVRWDSIDGIAMP
jgi:opacity protein-like surface antigen